MPTPPMSDDLAREVVEAWVAHNHRSHLAAASLGLNPKTFDYRLQVAKARGLHLSPGARDIVDAARLAPVEARGGWVHSYDDEGKKIGATRWSTPEDSPSPEALADMLAAAFASVPPPPRVVPPKHFLADLCGLLPFFDVHWGMKAWGQETGGQDYDLKLAQSDLVQAVDRVLTVIPNLGQAVLLIGGDFFHANDNTAATPASKHKMDVDGRMDKTIETAIHVLAFVIQRLRGKAKHVLVRVLRGNHDEDSYRALKFALWAWFKDVPNVTVDTDPRDLFMFQWGRTGIFAHHGDKTTPKDFVLNLADQVPFWTAAPHRYAYTGDKHRLAAERIGGVQWEQLDAFCPPDSYGSRWTGRRAFRAEVFHKQTGRFLTAHDPLEREGEVA